MLSFQRSEALHPHHSFTHELALGAVYVSGAGFHRRVAYSEPAYTFLQQLAPQWYDHSHRGLCVRAGSTHPTTPCQTPRLRPLGCRFVTPALKLIGLAQRVTTDTRITGNGELNPSVISSVAKSITSESIYHSVLSAFREQRTAPNQ